MGLGCCSPLASDSVQSEKLLCVRDSKTQPGSLFLGSSSGSITPCSRRLGRPSEGPVQLFFPELERDIFAFLKEPFP